MRKTLSILLLFGSLITIGFGQTNKEIYKSSVIRLEPVEGYGASNDWDALLMDTYNEKINTYQLGADKKILVASDGSVFMSHKTIYEIWKFDPQGNLTARFGEKGTREDQFPFQPELLSLIGSDYVVTTDANARLKFFDMSGKFQFAHYHDYVVKGLRRVSGNRYQFTGNVLWNKNGKHSWRNLVEEADLDLKHRKTLYSSYSEAIDFITPLERQGDSMVFVNPEPRERKSKFHIIPAYLMRTDIRFFPEGFLVSDPETGRIQAYSMDGEKVHDFVVPVQPMKVTEQEVQDMYQKSLKSTKEMIERIENTKRRDIKVSSYEAYKKYLIESWENNSEELRHIENYHPYYPYYSTIHFDDAGNMLVFEMSRKGQDTKHRFTLVSIDQNGKKIGESEIVCADYELNLSNWTFHVREGFVYAVCMRKDSEGIPFRLMKFKMVAID